MLNSQLQAKRESLYHDSWQFHKVLRSTHSSLSLRQATQTGYGSLVYPVLYQVELCRCVLAYPIRFPGVELSSRFGDLQDSLSLTCCPISYGDWVQGLRTSRKRRCKSTDGLRHCLLLPQLKDTMYTKRPRSSNLLSS